MENERLGLIRELVETAQAHQADVGPFLVLHSPDAIIVNLAGRRVLGRDDLRQAMTAALASSLTKVTTRIEIHDIRFLGADVAIVSCTKHVSDERDSTGTLPTQGSLTYVVVADHQEWKIALAQTTPILGS